MAEWGLEHHRLGVSRHRRLREWGFVLLLVSLCWPGILLARSGTYRFEKLSVSEGLSQNTVFCILQDRRGFMWFGTQDGLNRYDGHEFLVYQHDSADPDSISDSWVLSLCEDRDGYLWVGTYNGLNRFDPGTGKFVHYFHDNNNPRSLIHNRVYRIVQDAGGDIWVGTRGGLDRLRRGEKGFTHYRHNPQVSHSLSSNRIRDLLVDHHDRIWVATDAGLNLFDRGSGTFNCFQHDPADPDSLTHNNISSLCQTDDGTIWVGTLGGGLDRRRENGTFQHYRYEPDNPTGLSSDQVSVLGQGINGELWVGTRDNGLSRLNLATGKWERFRHLPLVPGSLGDNAIRSLLETESGVLWVGTYTGINKFCRLLERFHHVIPDPLDPRGFGGEVVWSFCEDRSGNLWVGTNRGVEIMDPVDGHFTHLRPESPARDGGIPTGSIMSIIEDTDGRMWLGSMGNGLMRFDRNRRRRASFTHRASDPTSISSNIVWTLYQDHQGVIWAGTDRGLNRLDDPRGKFTTFRHSADDPASLSGNTVLCIREDSRHILWVGTSAGLNRYDANTGTFRAYRHDPADPTSLAHNWVYAIQEDENGCLWLGTRGGLDYFDPQRKTFEHYTVSDGLPNAVIYGILRDDRGNLWLTTNGGLSCFSPQEKTFRNFDTHDGLQSNEFNRGAWARGRSGRLYIGGGNGFNMFDPVMIPQNSRVPPVAITTLWLNSEGSNRRINIVGRSQLELTHEDTVFTLEFSALDYVAPEKNTYAFKLEGFNTDWVKLGHRREVTFTNLKPGSYTFRVKAANNDGVWNEEGSSLALVIRPLFWFSGWAYALYGLLLTTLVGAAVATGVRNYRRTMTRKQVEIQRQQQLNQRLQEVDRLKDEFLAMTSHELRSPLSGIIGIVESLQHGAVGQLSQRAVSNLAMVEASARRLSNLVNDIQDFSRLKYFDIKLRLQPVDVRQVCDMVLAMCQPLVAGKSLELRNDIPVGFPFAKADENRLQQILHNLVCNAIKFTDSGSVSVTGQTNDDIVEITVADTGMGIPADHLDDIFRTYEQLDDGRVNGHSGMGLGLSITRKLVELHGGTIQVSSEPGQGSRFTFSLAAIYEPTVPLREVVRPADLRTEQEITTVVPAEEESVTRPTHRIMVVEDDVVNLQLLVNHLSLQNFYVAQAMNGFEALALLESDTRFDLVLLDIMMPRLSGFDVCRKIRERFSPDELPVIMLTGRNQVADLVQGLDCGANDYIVKPFSRNELLARIRTHLRLLQSSRQIKEYSQQLEVKVAERTTELARKNEILEKINRIVQSINARNSLDDLLDTILTEVHEIRGVKRAWALVLDPDSGHLNFRAVQGMALEDLRDVTLTPAQAEERYVRRSRILDSDIFLASDLAPDPDIGLDESMSLPHSLLVMRIQVDDYAEGYLLFENSSEDVVFDDENILLLRQLRNHIVSAFIKSRLMAQLQATNRDLRHAYRQMEELSLTDPLTGMRNRRFLLKYIEHETSKVLRRYQKLGSTAEGETPVDSDIVFVILDLDHFKMVNDTYGHSAGDELLVQVRQRLEKVCRDSDIIVRWGGEEFLVVSRDANPRHAPAIAERIRHAVQSLPFVVGEGQAVRITCSLGFACYPFLPGTPELMNWEQVLAVADHGLLASKKAGRNTWVGIMSTSRTSPENLFHRLLAGMETLIQSGELEVLASVPDIWMLTFP